MPSRGGASIIAADALALAVERDEATVDAGKAKEVEEAEEEEDSRSSSTAMCAVDADK